MKFCLALNSYRLFCKCFDLLVDAVCIKTILLQKLKCRTRLTECIIHTDLHNLCRSFL